MSQRPASRFSLALVVPLAVLASAVFLVFLASTLVENDLIRAGYYQGVLRKTNAYDRAYDEIARDPELSPEVSSILGGGDLVGVDIASAMLGAVAPGLLQAATEEVIARIIEFVKANRTLDARLEITDIVRGLDGGTEFFNDLIPIGDLIPGLRGGGGLGGLFGPGAPIDSDIARIPARDAGSYTNLKAALESVVDEMRERGTLPGTIPSRPSVPQSRYGEVTAILTERAGITDRDVVRAIRADVEDDEIADAVRMSLTAIRAGNGGSPEPQRPPTQTGNDPLAGNPLVEALGGRFVTREGEGANARYFLGPPEDIRKEIEDTFEIVHLVSWMAPIGRPVTLVLLAIILVAIARVAWPDRALAARWVGIPLLAGGLIGFVGWWYGMALGEDELLRITLGDDPQLPASVERLWRDIVAQAFDDLAWTVWLPCIVAIVVGGALVAWSFTKRPRRAAPAGGTRVNYT